MTTFWPTETGGIQGSNAIFPGGTWSQFDSMSDKGSEASRMSCLKQPTFYYRPIISALSSVIHANVSYSRS